MLLQTNAENVLTNRAFSKIPLTEIRCFVEDPVEKDGWLHVSSYCEDRIINCVSSSQRAPLASVISICPLQAPPHPTPTLRMSIAYHCVVLQCFYLRWHGKGEKNTWWARQFCLISKPKNFSFPLPCVQTSISFTCFCIWHYIERIVHWSAWRFEAFSRFKQEWD